MGVNYPPSIDRAFGDQPDLRKKVYAALERDPTSLPLLSSISSYVVELKKSIPGAEDGPAAKKRKIENLVVKAENGAPAAGAWTDAEATPTFSVPGTSFQIPQRKKLNIQVLAPSSKADAANGIRAINPSSGDVEFGIGFSDIEHVFCLPVPEKAKRQDSFVALGRHSDGIYPAPEGVTVPEPMVWTSIEGPKFTLAQQEQEVGQTASAINQGLKPYGKKVIFPSDKEFVSNITQAHRKGEKAYHVKAFKGSKEGFLYFLSTGIIFGFKKPILFFPFSSIASISYTSVLQRTFNLLITTQPAEPSDQAGQDVEFSMLDQVDYTPIDEYIKRHGLNDASMAEDRRAKRLNINGPPEGGEDGAEEESELQKAEMQFQDEEDEDEEDYDPGSEGESEGSGASSDEDDDDDDDDDDEGQDDEDMDEDDDDNTDLKHEED